MAVRPDLDPLNLISLCTGGGGLDRAVELAIPTARPVLCVEREAFAVANLVTQMQQRVMAAAPVWSDVRTVPGRRFRGRVDGVIGGIPCQPYSLAGKRLGREDERDLWGAARRIFVQSGAWFILIENVGGMLSEGGAERVRGDLLRLGCKVEGGLFRASEVGFSHERERLFILGVADRDGEHGDRRGVVGPRRGGTTFRRPKPELRRGRGSAGRAERTVADAGRPGRQQVAGSPHGDEGPDEGRGAEHHHITERAGQGVADADIVELRRVPSAEEQSVVQQDDGVGVLDDASRLDRGLHPRRGAEGRRTLDAGGAGEVVDTLGGRRDGRPREPVGSPEERAAVEWASQGPLFAPGPGDADAWAWIADRAPERLPALSRHDLFRVEVGKARAVAHGLAPPGLCKAWGDTPPETWVDQGGPYGLRTSVVQAIAQSTFRRGSDGVAARIDELRLLGNGVVDLAGAYALRTLATDLARRSAGATLLVRMMGEP